MASIANEPYAAVYTLVQAQTDLLAALTGGYGKDQDITVGGFPKLNWVVESSDHGPSDAENWLYRDERLQFSLWGSDPDQIVDLAALVDAMNDACDGAVMNTDHWAIKLFRRELAWVKIPILDKQVNNGELLYKMTSVWRFKAVARQNQ